MSDHKQLHEYIDNEKKRGVRHEDIKNKLIEHGWDKETVHQSVHGAERAMTPPSAPNSMQQKRLKKRPRILIVVVSFVLLVGVGGAIAYQYVWNSPERVVAAMFEHLQSLDSFAIEGTLTASANLDEFSAENVATFEQSTGGLLPLSTADRYAQDLELSFQGAVESFTNVDNMSSRATLSLPTGMKMNMMLFPEQTFLQLAAYPGIDVFLPSDTLIDRWILLDFAELQAQLGLDKLIEEVEQQRELTPPEPLLTLEQEEVLRKRLLSEQVFKLTKLDDGEINEREMHHFRYDIDIQELQAIINETQAMISDEEAVATLEEFSAMTQERKSDISGEMWIGKDDYQLYRFTMEAEITNDSIGEGSVVATVALAMDISGHNTEQNIIAPDEYVTIQELLEEFLNAPMFGAMEADDAFMTSPSFEITDSDGDGLADDLEALYGSDPNNPDTDGDGFTDNEEVMNDYNPNGDGKLW